MHELQPQMPIGSTAFAAEGSALQVQVKWLTVWLPGSAAVLQTSSLTLFLDLMSNEMTAPSSPELRKQWGWSGSNANLWALPLCFANFLVSQ